MKPLNALIYALRSFGGFATPEQLEAYRPKLKDVMKSQVELVDMGEGYWDEAPDGTQQLRLTDSMMMKMAGREAVSMTIEELRAALERGDDLRGRTIYIPQGR